MSEEVTPDQNVMYIGRKPVMSYVLAIMTGFTGSNASQIVLRARGRAITTAVDAAEITRRRFMQELHVSKISIGTEELPQELGRTKAVSTIDITLTRSPAGNPREPETSQEAESGTLSQPVALTSIKGIGVKSAEKLRSCGIRSVQDLATRDPQDLSNELQLSAKRVSTWIEDARKAVEHRGAT